MEEILIINKQKEIDFSNEYIRNFWLHSNKTTNIKQESNLITFIGNLEKVTEFINQASEMLCIYSSEFSNEIYNLILDTSTSKRIYFLTNDKSLGKDQLQSLAGNILIRLIKQIIKDQYCYPMLVLILMVCFLMELYPLKI